MTRQSTTSSRGWSTRRSTRRAGPTSSDAASSSIGGGPPTSFGVPGTRSTRRTWLSFCLSEPQAIPASSERSAMSSARPRMLFVSDLTYPARGRRYCDEDIHLSSRLRASFDVAVCHPLDAAALMDEFDVVVVRNSGPVVDYLAEYDEFRDLALKHDKAVYNQLTGKADMLGKRYLADLSSAGCPVIPTVDAREDLARLPDADEYVVKPVRGADSAGLRYVRWDQLEELRHDGLIVQPRVNFQYEVSFYFVDHACQYALYAPQTDERW